MERCRRRADYGCSAVCTPISDSFAIYDMARPVHRAPRNEKQAASVPIAEAVVFLVSDCETRRQSLSQTLASMGFRSKVFATLGEYQKSLVDREPGCLLYDGKTCAAALGAGEPPNDGFPAPPVIFLTDDTDVSIVVRAMRGGAVDLLLRRSFVEAELWDALQLGLTRDVENRAAYAVRCERQRRLATLTGPEKEVLGLLVVGKNNREIAEQCGVTRATVEGRRMRLMRKLGAKHLPALVEFAVSADFG